MYIYIYIDISTYIYIYTYILIDFLFKLMVLHIDHPFADRWISMAHDGSSSTIFPQPLRTVDTLFLLLG